MKARLAEPISIVAHQLKSPVSVIKLYLESLLTENIGKLNEKQKEYLRDSLENVKRVVAIVNDLLDVSKIEENKYDMKLQIIDLGEIVKSVVDDFFYMAQASNSEIKFEKYKEPAFVNADPIKIRQVIDNLISNAIKYKSSGRGKVEVGIKKIDDSIIFSCSDNGMGIPEGDFDKVFSKFYRSSEALEADPSGTGLGLYINKAIIELSRGKIWFEKNKDAGITFYFSLPVAQY